MRIAIIHWGYPPVIGGVETHLSLLGPYFVKEGHSVSLLTGAHTESRSSYTDRGMHVTRLPIMDLNWLYKRGFTNLDKEVRKSTRSFLDKADPEVLHVHNMHYFSELHAKIVEEEACRRNVPLILTAHNVWADSLCMKLTREIKWSRVIAVSNFIKHSLEGFGLDGGKVTTIHHGIDGAPFFKASAKKAYAKYPILRGKRIFFHPARMGLAKGSDVVVQAFRRIKEKAPDAFLVLAGTKNIIDWGETQERDIAYILELLDMFNLREHTLIDQYPLSLMPAMYAAAEVVAYPSSMAEPFGIAMLESFAATKPLIVSCVGGMPEVVRNGKTGYVIEPLNHQELAETAIQMFKNHRLARSVAKAGNAAFKKQYTLPRMAEDTIAVYQDAIQKHRM